MFRKGRAWALYAALWTLTAEALTSSTVFPHFTTVDVTGKDGATRAAVLVSGGSITSAITVQATPSQSDIQLGGHEFESLVDEAYSAAKLAVSSAGAYKKEPADPTKSEQAAKAIETAVSRIGGVANRLFLGEVVFRCGENEKVEGILQAELESGHRNKDAKAMLRLREFNCRLLTVLDHVQASDSGSGKGFEFLDGDLKNLAGLIFAGPPTIHSSSSVTSSTAASDATASNAKSLSTPSSSTAASDSTASDPESSHTPQASTAASATMASNAKSLSTPSASTAASNAAAADTKSLSTPGASTAESDSTASDPESSHTPKASTAASDTAAANTKSLSSPSPSTAASEITPLPAAVSSPGPAVGDNPPLSQGPSAPQTEVHPSETTDSGAEGETPLVVPPVVVPVGGTPGAGAGSSGPGGGTPGAGPGSSGPGGGTPGAGPGSLGPGGGNPGLPGLPHIPAIGGGSPGLPSIPGGGGGHNRGGGGNNRGGGGNNGGGGGNNGDGGGDGRDSRGGNDKAPPDNPSDDKVSNSATKAQTKSELTSASESQFTSESTSESQTTSESTSSATEEATSPSSVTSVSSTSSEESTSQSTSETSSECSGSTTITQTTVYVSETWETDRERGQNAQTNTPQDASTVTQELVTSCGAQPSATTITVTGTPEATPEACPNHNSGPEVEGDSPSLVKRMDYAKFVADKYYERPFGNLRPNRPVPNYNWLSAEDFKSARSNSIISPAWNVMARNAGYLAFKNGWFPYVEGSSRIDLGDNEVSYISRATTKSGLWGDETMNVMIPELLGDTGLAVLSRQGWWVGRYWQDQPTWGVAETIAREEEDGLANFVNNPNLAGGKGTMFNSEYKPRIFFISRRPRMGFWREAGNDLVLRADADAKTGHDTFGDTQVIGELEKTLDTELGKIDFDWREGWDRVDIRYTSVPDKDPIEDLPASVIPHDMRYAWVTLGSCAAKLSWKDRRFSYIRGRFVVQYQPGVKQLDHNQGSVCEVPGERAVGYRIWMEGQEIEEKSDGHDRWYGANHQIKYIFEDIERAEDANPEQIDGHHGRRPLTQQEIRDTIRRLVGGSEEPMEGVTTDAQLTEEQADALSEQVPDRDIQRPALDTVMGGTEEFSLMSSMQQEDLLDDMWGIPDSWVQDAVQELLQMYPDYDLGAHLSEHSPSPAHDLDFPPPIFPRCPTEGKEPAEECEFDPEDGGAWGDWGDAGDAGESDAGGSDAGGSNAGNAGEGNAGGGTAVDGSIAIPGWTIGAGPAIARPISHPPPDTWYGPQNFDATHTRHLDKVKSADTRFFLTHVWAATRKPELYVPVTPPFRPGSQRVPSSAPHLLPYEASADGQHILWKKKVLSFAAIEAWGDTIFAAVSRKGAVMFRLWQDEPDWGIGEALTGVSGGGHKLKNFDYGLYDYINNDHHPDGKEYGHMLNQEHNPTLYLITRRPRVASDEEMQEKLDKFKVPADAAEWLVTAADGRTKKNINLGDRAVVTKILSTLKKLYQSRKSREPNFQWKPTFKFFPYIAAPLPSPLDETSLPKNVGPLLPYKAMIHTKTRCAVLRDTQCHTPRGKVLIQYEPGILRTEGPQNCRDSRHAQWRIFIEAQVPDPSGDHWLADEDQTVTTKNPILREPDPADWAVDEVRDTTMSGRRRARDNPISSLPPCPGKQTPASCDRRPERRHAVRDLDDVRDLDWDHLLDPAYISSASSYVDDLSCPLSPSDSKPSDSQASEAAASQTNQPAGKAGAQTTPNTAKKIKTRTPSGSLTSESSSLSTPKTLARTPSDSFTSETPAVSTPEPSNTGVSCGKASDCPAAFCAGGRSILDCVDEKCTCSSPEGPKQETCKDGDASTCKRDCAKGYMAFCDDDDTCNCREEGTCKKDGDCKTRQCREDEEGQCSAEGKCRCAPTLITCTEEKDCQNHRCPREGSPFCADGNAGNGYRLCACPKVDGDRCSRTRDCDSLLCPKGYTQECNDKAKCECVKPVVCGKEERKECDDDGGKCKCIKPGEAFCTKNDHCSYKKCQTGQGGKCGKDEKCYCALAGVCQVKVIENANDGRYMTASVELLHNDESMVSYVTEPHDTPGWSVKIPKKGQTNLQNGQKGESQLDYDFEVQFVQLSDRKLKRTVHQTLWGRKAHPPPNLYLSFKAGDISWNSRDALGKDKLPRCEVGDWEEKSAMVELQNTGIPIPVKSLLRNTVGYWEC